MSFYSKTRLQTLFWEIKSRFFYILFSFFLSLTVAYQNSTSLLYLFISSYTTKSKTFFLSSFFLSKLNLLFAALHASHKHENSFCANFILTSFTRVENALKKSQEYDLFSIFALGEQGKSLSEEEQLFFFTESDSSFLSLLESQSTLVRHDNSFSLFSNDFLCTLNESSLISFSKAVNSIDITSINFIFTDVEEAFSSQILVCFIFSFMMSFPVLIYAVLSFLVPSLYLYESKKWISRFFVFIAIWYCFTLVVQNKIIPKLAEFLLRFQINSEAFNVRAETKIYSYCAWASTIFIVTSLLFLCFYILFFFIANEKIKINSFTRRRKWCRIVLLFISALIAPPDLTVQLILTFFLILCFEAFAQFFFIYRHILNFRSFSQEPKKFFKS